MGVGLLIKIFMDMHVPLGVVIRNREFAGMKSQLSRRGYARLLVACDVCGIDDPTFVGKPVCWIKQGLLLCVPEALLLLVCSFSVTWWKNSKRLEYCKLNQFSSEVLTSFYLFIFPKLFLTTIWGTLWKWKLRCWMILQGHFENVCLLTHWQIQQANIWTQRRPADWQAARSLPVCNRHPASHAMDSWKVCTVDRPLSEQS